MKKINYIKNAKVTKVSEDKIGNVSVTIIENNRSIVKTYDKVFLGAGAIGTSKIILNSTENICKIELKTNDLISIPYICFSKPFEKLHSFGVYIYDSKQWKSNILVNYMGSQIVYSKCLKEQYRLFIN